MATEKKLILRPGSLTCVRGFKYNSDLTWKLLVVWKTGRLVVLEVATYERFV